MTSPRCPGPVRMVDPATRAANGASRREEAHAFPIQAAGVRRFARCARRTPTDGRWMRIAAMSRHQRGARQRKNACLRSPKDPNANRRMGRSSGFRIGLLTAPSRPARSRYGRDLRRTVVFAAFVPGYSGGTATDSHRLPYSSSGPQARDDTHVAGHPNARGTLVNSRIRRSDRAPSAISGVECITGYRRIRTSLLPDASSPASRMIRWSVRKLTSVER
jgi:hypothetical protein